jgi:hypothetical protein
MLAIFQPDTKANDLILAVNKLTEAKFEYLFEHRINLAPFPK